MGNEAASADLLMKLYDLRREPTMREARNWYVGSFFPESSQDVMTAMIAPESSAFYRMVVSYWDMAATFVNHNAINEEMFNAVSGESVVVFSKIEPYLAELRETMGSPKMLLNLETLIMRMPDAKELLVTRREMIKRMIAARSEMAKSA
ncbi:MAG: hypothetical protein ABIP78_06730 [Pyrinomonadaceae bacterium]